MTPQLDWLRQWAQFSPHAIAFNETLQNGPIRAWSYSHVYRLSCRLARAFAARATGAPEGLGIQRGDRVAVLAANEFEYPILFFALQRLGAIMVPLNYRLTAPELEHILADSDARVLIYQSAFAGVVSQLTASQAGAAALPAAPLRNFDATPRPAWARAEAQWLVDGPDGVAALLRDETSAEDGPLAMPDLEESDPCMILYTSGTTGAPKGAVVTHKMLFWNAVNTTLRLDLRQTDVALSFLPFFHTGGWNVLLTPFVHRGARTAIMAKFDAARVLELCESERVTILFGVPTMMDMMAREPGFQSADLSSVRFAIVGGEPMPIELIKLWQAKGVAIRQGYGLTEFGPNVFSLNEEDGLRKIGSIGFPNFYVEAKVLADDGGEILDGGVGELALRGPICTPGYWRNAEATRQTIRDGWLMTGDLVRRDEEGYYYVAGRKKDMYISGGENVYPVEVERLLSSHPSIREVAVIGVPDPKWGEVGKAFVALKAGAAIAADDLLAFCTGKLAKFKIPKQFEFLPDLPKGDSGKVLKRKLRPA